MSQFLILSKCAEFMLVIIFVASISNYVNAVHIAPKIGQNRHKRPFRTCLELSNRFTEAEVQTKSLKEQEV